MTCLYWLLWGKHRGMYEVQQLIGGSWAPGGATRKLTVVSPIDGSPVTRVPIATGSDVTAAVKAARDAAPGWARTAPAARASALHAAATALQDAADDLAAIMSAEMGKPVGGAR